MFVKEIKYQYEDNGVTSIKLETTFGKIQGLFRAFTPAEIFAWNQYNNNMKLPSPIVELSGDPRSSLIQKLINNGVIVKYYPDIMTPYYLDHVKATLNYQLDRQFPIISLPDYKESTTEFRNKLDIANKVISEHQNKDNCQMMPYIRLDHEKNQFENRLSAILNRNFKMLGIDVHGNNTINLSYLKEDLSKWETDIWVHGSNIPKKFDNLSKASYPHILTYYHVHTYALRKGRYYPTLYSENIEHFDSLQLGVIPWKDLPFSFGVDCNCPAHRQKPYFTDNVNDMYTRARNHNMFDEQTELHRAIIPIKENTYERYIKSKRCAKMALFG